MTRSAPLNPLVATLSAPPIPAVQAWGRAYDGRHGPLIDLSQAVPGYAPEPRMLAWLAEAAGSRAASGYGPIEGEDAAREAYAAHLREIYGSPFVPANIHMTAGCNQAFVAVAMALAGAGDAILMTDPCYFNHETSLRMMGVTPRFVACDAETGFLPDPRDVERALGPDVRALALVSPNNPTGAVYPLHLLADLFAVCRKRGIWLILDETYRDFLPLGRDRPHELFSVPGWQDNLVQLYSFSKSFCIPGHRLGAVTAAPALVDALSKVMDNIQICAPRVPQMAVAKALPALAAWRAENRLEIARRADALRTAIERSPGWSLDAVGAYFAFVRHPFPETGAAATAERLAREAGIVTIPGTFFGVDREGHLRFAFANATSEAIALLPERLAVLGK